MVGFLPYRFCAVFRDEKIAIRLITDKYTRFLHIFNRICDKKSGPGVSPAYLRGDGGGCRQKFLKEKGDFLNSRFVLLLVFLLLLYSCG